MEKIELIDQIHRCLPQTKTQEGLSKFITEQQKEVKTHVRKVPYTPEEVSDFEHKSSAASRAIDRLNAIKEQFMYRLKKGTDIDPNNPEQFLPFDITIPPSKGLDALKANREFADDAIERGYNEETTEIYMIPYPEEEMMVAVTIEGHEAPKYTRKMTSDENALYGKLFVKEGDELRQLDNAEVDVSYNGTAKINTRKKGRNREAII